MTGNSGSSDTKQEAVPWKAQRPYLRDIFEQAQGLYGAEGPNLYPGQTIAGFTPQEQQAQQAVEQYATGGMQQLAGQTQGANQFLLGDVLYPESNPALQAHIEGAIRPIAQDLRESTLPAIRSGAIAAGQFGGSLQGKLQNQAIERATRAMGDTSARIASDAYGQGLEAMQRGIAMAPGTGQFGLAPSQALSGVGAQLRSYEQAMMDDAARRYEYDQQLPYNKLAAYQQLIQGNYGGTGRATTGGGGTLQNILGAAGAGLSTYGALGGPSGMLAGTAMAPAAPWIAGGMALASLFA